MSIFLIHAIFTYTSPHVRKHVTEGISEHNSASIARYEERSEAETVSSKYPASGPQVDRKCDNSAYINPTPGIKSLLIRRQHIRLETIPGTYHTRDEGNATDNRTISQVSSV